VSLRLVPQEFQCSEGRTRESPEPQLVKDIQVFGEMKSALADTRGNGPRFAHVLEQARSKLFTFHAKSKNFEASLARSGHYTPRMKRIFPEYGLPQNLIYGALV
jgi:hypothetical protein